MNDLKLTTGLLALTALSFGTLAFGMGCSSETDPVDNTTVTSSSSSTGGQGGQGGQGGAASASLSVELSGLEELGDGSVYEGWLIVDGMPVTAGRFNVDGSDSYEFDVAADDADNATAYVLTIEPMTGDDPAPSATHVLAGDIVDGSASLSIGHAAALGTDFATMAGSYILNTPSTANDSNDYDQGIWWLEVTGNGPAASLTLPALPAGWVYEGWVVGQSGPISTGRFSVADAEDSDGKGAGAGPDGTPPFPGQDFITPAEMLAGYTVVISVEPMPDDSPMPFAIKPLIDPMIEDMGIGVSEMMTNMSANNPAGTMTMN
jgi:hypothetical protein